MPKELYLTRKIPIF